ncbi:hypothetical protein V1478_009346 [Vespula squamosa]|uniref:Uncharacterized protein n=1 Tax=Vespula squamosa TaxID=30214 RepID=A0ABD2APE7_VESSQ
MFFLPFESIRRDRISDVSLLIEKIRPGGA